MLKKTIILFSLLSSLAFLNGEKKADDGEPLPNVDVSKFESIKMFS